MSESAAVLAARLKLPAKPPRPHPYYDYTPKVVEVEGDRIQTLDIGTGPPLLLVHGLMTSAYSWRYVLDGFAERYRVIAVDLPGAGGSQQRPDRPHGPAAMGAFLVRFMDAMQLHRCRVVANSLGGVFALRLLADEPERVSRICVMHSPGFPELRVRAMRTALAIPPVRAAFARYLVRRRHRFVSRHVHYAEPLLSVEEVVVYARIFESLQGAKTFVRILRDALAPRELKALHADLRARPPHCPILLLWAREDVLVPAEYGDRYKALLPEADLVWMEGVSHFMHVDDPEATLGHILPFLE